MWARIGGIVAIGQRAPQIAANADTGSKASIKTPEMTVRDRNQSRPFEQWIP
ncbi:MAG: hypothetical protein H0X25_16120 [Acidobacteriales bacterium]|nr:hypothetical protein [Terriglobales bacterium]